MLDYGLVPTPETDQFWEIREGSRPDKRWLCLRHEVTGKRGKVSAVTLVEIPISDYHIKEYGFEFAVREAAKEVVRVTANFNLPTGRVI